MEVVSSAEIRILRHVSVRSHITGSLHLLDVGGVSLGHVTRRHEDEARDRVDRVRVVGTWSRHPIVELLLAIVFERSAQY